TGSEARRPRPAGPSALIGTGGSGYRREAISFPRHSPAVRRHQMRTRVQDVMTTDVVSVREDATFQEVARLLIGHGVSGMPVLDAAGRVVGVISEADLLHKEEFKERYHREGYRPPLTARLRHRLGSEGDTRRKAEATTARELMTSPAYTTTPNTPVVL